MFVFLDFLKEEFEEFIEKELSLPARSSSDGSGVMRYTKVTDDFSTSLVTASKIDIWRVLRQVDWCNPVLSSDTSTKLVKTFSLV